MNRTHLEHAIIALVIQLALWPLFGPWASAAVACAVFLGREIAQHEYRLAVFRGWKWGGPKPVRWHEGFWRGWTPDSVLDVLSPLLACWLIAWLSRYCPLLS
jgi:hypothetical protein